MRKIIIDQALFDQFPTFKRGVIIVSNLENASGNKRIKKPLNKEIEKRAQSNSVESEMVTKWDEVHKAFGSNPNKYPPSIKSLLKRIQKGGGFPYINSVVALFNYISIKYLIPCGGDDIDTIQGNLHLGYSNGNEKFIPLGSEEEESPEKGEVIYYDDQALSVMCRRWNWRNGDFTKITLDTKKIVINIDGVGDVSKSQIEEARDELAHLLIEHCKAELSVDFLDQHHREIEIDL